MQLALMIGQGRAVRNLLAARAWPVRLIISGAPVGETLELGPPREPVSRADAPPTPAAGPRIKLEQMRTEASLLPRSDARADGSHYLHGSASVEWPISELWSARLAARADGYVQTGDADFERAELDYGESFVRYRGPDRRVTLGAQTVLWGQVDEIPPTDRLNVK